MPYNMVNDPQHWRDCARDVRAMIENVIDPGAKETLLKVAAGYDELARKAEQCMSWARSKESAGPANA